MFFTLPVQLNVRMILSGLLSFSDPNVDILSLDIPVNAIATVLKSFFNDLTEPLVPRFLHDELIEAASKLAIDEKNLHVVF